MVDRIVDELNGDGPTWFKILVRFGGYAAIAAFLLWYVTYRLDGKIDAMAGDHQSIKFYMRQVCLNTATTDAQARGCYEAERLGAERGAAK